MIDFPATGIVLVRLDIGVADLRDFLRRKVFREEMFRKRLQNELG